MWKQQGNIALTHAIHYFTKKQNIVSLPINDSQDYDLIVDIDSTLCKVQVKSTIQVSRCNIPTVSVKSSGGTYGKIYGNVKTSSANLLYIYHITLDKAWLIPITDSLPASSINLGEKYEQYLLT